MARSGSAYKETETEREIDRERGEEGTQVRDLIQVYIRITGILLLHTCVPQDGIGMRSCSINSISIRIALYSAQLSQLKCQRVPWQPWLLLPLLLLLLRPRQLCEALPATPSLRRLCQLFISFFSSPLSLRLLLLRVIALNCNPFLSVPSQYPLVLSILHCYTVDEEQVLCFFN